MVRLRLMVLAVGEVGFLYDPIARSFHVCWRQHVRLEYMVQREASAVPTTALLPPTTDTSSLVRAAIMGVHPVHGSDRTAEIMLGAAKSVIYSGKGRGRTMKTRKG